MIINHFYILNKYKSDFFYLNGNSLSQSFHILYVSAEGFCSEGYIFMFLKTHYNKSTR